MTLSVVQSYGHHLNKETCIKCSERHSTINISVMRFGPYLVIKALPADKVFHLTH